MLGLFLLLSSVPSASEVLLRLDRSGAVRSPHKGKASLKGENGADAHRGSLRVHGSQNQPRREPSRLAPPPPTSGGVSSVTTFETKCTAFPALAGWCDAIRQSPRQCACDDSTASIYKYVPYGSNFGDMVGPMILEGFVSCGAQCQHFDRATATGQPRPVLVGLGSVLHHHYSQKKSGNKGAFSKWARKNITVTTHLWGTGEIGFGGGFHYHDADPRVYSQRGGRFHTAATRGPLTRDFLARNGLLAEPSAEPVFGDPALLLPSLFPRCRRSCKPTRKLCIIPHHGDLALLQKEVQSGMAPVGFNETNVRKVQTKVEDMVEFILGCELVVSSSLHGIIFAEAFGVPARWWAPLNGGTARTERAFKYQDYYAGTRPHLFERYRELWSGSESHNGSAPSKCAGLENACAECLKGGSSCTECKARGFNCACACAANRKWEWKRHQGLATKIYAHGPLVSDPFKPAATLAEAVQLGGAPPLTQYDATALLEAFPLDLATGCQGGPRKRSARAEPLGANRACLALISARLVRAGS